MRITGKIRIAQNNSEASHLKKSFLHFFSLSLLKAFVSNTFKKK